jgi:hypothetical protein
MAATSKGTDHAEFKSSQPKWVGHPGSLRN